MNFMNSTQVAVFQDHLLDRFDRAGYLTLGRNVTSDELKTLESSAWVATAAFMSPCNLVIRQWCLISIIKQTLNYQIPIINQMNAVCPDIWAEGYSYWQYVKRALISYIKAVENVNHIPGVILSVERFFERTAYRDGQGKLRPAPFGDLRVCYIDNQLALPEDSVKCIFLEKISDTYVIDPFFVKLNLHVPSKKTVIKIVNGVPDKFKFYEGFDKKYSNVFQQTIDVLKPGRLLSFL